jgi:hypothetical protein
MPCDDPTAVQAIVEHIESYLAEHPGAADTIEGIRKWWLPAELLEQAPSNVQSALDRLVARGDVSKRVLPDGKLLYAQSPATSVRS